jgi:single-strand DNA-binding protein
MAHYVFDGIVKEIFDTQEFKNNFKKREIVVLSDETYPKPIKFEFSDENGINKLDEISEGEHVRVAFELSGNEYQGKYYNNNKGIAIVTLDEEKKFAQDQAKEAKSSSKTTKNDVVADDDSDDLPF